MAASTPVGRPKIEGLVTFNLRFQETTRDALDRIVAERREATGNPALTVTDVIREVLAAYAKEHDPVKKKSRK